MMPLDHEGEVVVVYAHDVQTRSFEGWKVLGVVEEDITSTSGGDWVNGAQQPREVRVLRVPKFILGRTKEETLKTLRGEIATREKMIEDCRKRIETLDGMVKVKEKEAVDATNRLKKEEEQRTHLVQNMETKYKRDVELLVGALGAKNWPAEERQAIESIARLGDTEQVLMWIGQRTAKEGTG